jgi:prolyl-tRNA synthetase
MRTRPFLRTTEFLWQEGHTAHATADEALEETLRMLGVYRSFMEGWMAMPLITGEKTASERFAGAERTFALEGLMRDNKALQVGTSHYLGQNFARAFGVTFQTEDGEHDHVFNTSWGVSTRMVGGLIMSHGDDVGLVLPPKLAPHQVVIVPIWKSDEQRASVLEAAARVRAGLQGRVRVHIDARDTLNPGAKYYEWERRGVPLRLEIGPRDVEKGETVVVRRLPLGDAPRKEPLKLEAAIGALPGLLDEIQDGMLREAVERREANSLRGVEDYDVFKTRIEEVGGFVYTGWCGREGCEERVKEDTKATIRVIPDEDFRSETAPRTCVACGEAAIEEVVWAKAY